MIGRLTGILLEKQAPQLLLDVMGVAYELEASLHTFAKLPELGHNVSLHTHLQVREDAFLLYGFYEVEERALFKNLIKVNGIGPKLALTVLSHITAEALMISVMEKDPARLQQIPGIGKKTAERLIIEMKDKFVHWHTQASNNLGNSIQGSGVEKAKYEAVSALIALGYKPNEAQAAIALAAKEGESSSEGLIRTALKTMMR